MIRDIQKLKEGPFDLLVIGGGINGSAIANLAADAGLRTALLEKGDFASGTSSKSTKLLHGGLRYLESFEFGLVHESLKERTIHFKSSPHLTKHLRFLIPIYKTDKRPFWMLKIGMFLYDFLSGKHLIQKHEILTAEEVLLKEPSLASKDLIGGVIYSDVQMNDARFCLENVLSAQEKGACVANYVEVKSIIKENGKAVGVIARDLKSGESIEIRASKIICAVGSWTNEFMRKEITKFPAKVRNTKGVHIVYKEKFSERAFLIPSHRDNRILFVIPWLNHSLIGTTDTDFTGSPDNVGVKEKDVEYLLEEAQRIFSKHDFCKENILSSFAGLRPLVSQEGSPSQVSRKYFIERSYTGILYVIGGKFTTFRKIAQECLNLVLKEKKSWEENVYTVYGSGKVSVNIPEIAKTFQVTEAVVKYLIDFYGIRYKDVLAIAAGDSYLKEPLIPGCQEIKAQVVYSIKVEMAQNLEDVLFRRLNLGYLEKNNKQCEATIKKIFDQYSNHL